MAANKVLWEWLPKCSGSSVPAQEMGRRAVEHVVAKLDASGGDGIELLAPELTVRAGKGPAPA